MHIDEIINCSRCEVFISTNKCRESTPCKHMLDLIEDAIQHKKLYTDHGHFYIGDYIKWVFEAESKFPSAYHWFPYDLDKNEILSYRDVKEVYDDWS